MANLTEPAFNTYLHQELLRICPKWTFTSGSERSKVLAEQSKQPDLTIQSAGGNTVIVETEFMPARTVEDDAKNRLGAKLLSTNETIETVIALRVPESLRSVDSSLGETIRGASYQYCIFSLIEQNVIRWPNRGWLRGDFRELADCIDLVSISERLLEEGTNIFELVVKQTADLIEVATHDGAQIGKNISSILYQEPSTQTYRMAMAILTNAAVYHDILSRHYEIAALDQVLQTASPDSEILAIWRHIIQDINFYPIFHLALELLSGLGARLALQVTEMVLQAARELAKLGATTLYDLSGRMFQRLIADRKFLATFYTLPASSALLSELAINAMAVDWDAEPNYKRLQIADFACGTGTLLAATYRLLLKRYEFLGKDSAEIHQDLLANSIIAADIMPAAVHLAASQLTSFHPQVKLLRTRVYTVPYGEQPSETGREISLGSLDLLESSHVSSLFGTGSQTLPPNLRDVVETELEVSNDSLDLVIMNPPFTRPTNHKVSDVPVPSFAGFSTSQLEQSEMSKKLKRFYQRIQNPIGNGNAGLASNFCDLAHFKLKPGGVLALVLPIAAISGNSWSRFRDVLATHYIDVTIVTTASSKSELRSFSADTGMAECLIIGRKKYEVDQIDAKWHYISLAQRPSTILEAIETAKQITKSRQTEYGSLQIGDTHLGNHSFGTPADTGFVSVRSLELGRFLCRVASNSDLAIRGPDTVSLNLVPLGQLGRRGLVHRDVGVVNLQAKQHRGPFAITKGHFDQALYPSLWWHDHLSEESISVQPDSRGEVIPGRETKASSVWQTASRLHFSLDFNTNSASIVACLTPIPSLGGRAWPTFQCDKPRWEVPLVLWANSSMGLMIFWWIGSKQHNGRSISTITKLSGVPVIDPRCLTDSQLSACEAVYSNISKHRLLPASQSFRDEVRHELDNFVLRDLCNAPAAWLKDFEIFREQWCVEPIVGKTALAD
ncbi:MAG: hypothetical protein F4W90_12680 [Gammaproteobacteria bacterium]|nr:hypothetical protein [Gammaproteobacteria bacterium]